MKRIACQFTYPTILAITTVLLTFMVLVSPIPSRAASPEPSAAAAGVSKTDRVEARIKELHAKLKITPEQEEQWSKVTQVMRDNAKTMEALINARLEKAGAMTAIEDLTSYGEIAQAHADGIKTFIPVFQPLYASMSDAQKKNADKLFHHQGSAKSKARRK